MLENNTIIKPPFYVKVVSSTEMAINGRKWYTREAYCEKVGSAATSTQVAYDHVRVGKADVISLFSTKMFSPKPVRKVILTTSSKEVTK